MRIALYFNLCIRYPDYPADSPQIARRLFVEIGLYPYGGILMEDD